ncbi:MAG: hypothetical protein BGN88_03040 [Clostridiales bacterium 43-6]|nr:MAG: hypothetical protein BGN88_03040 [Clostridiales bacterium 43-6]
MKSYKIHLIRHGITGGNLKGQYVGQIDEEITTDGINELLMLKTKYAYPKADTFFASPLKRCSETLRILYGDIEPVIIEGISECNFGEFQGKTFDELQTDELFRKWATAGNDITPPGGEASSEFTDRCIAAFDIIADTVINSEIPESVICTHGGVITTILAYYGLPKRDIYGWMCPAGCGFTVEIVPNSFLYDGTFEVIGDLPRGYQKEQDLALNTILKRRDTDE